MVLPFISYPLNKGGSLLRTALILLSGKPPAMPVEVPRKKALASSVERSELLISTLAITEKLPLKESVARSREVGQVMQVKEFSMPLERLASNGLL